MKIITKTDNSIALNHIDIFVFGKNQIVEVGGRFTDSNLHRMVELGFADLYDENNPIKKDDKDNDISFHDIDDKDELIEHAKENYDIDLDKRKSIGNMIADLANGIKNNKNETNKGE